MTPDLLLRASIDGAIAVAVVAAICRLVPTLSPSARAALWWCATAKFVVALVWTTPVALPVLPAPAAPAPVAISTSGELSQIMAGGTATLPTAPAAEPVWQLALAGLWLGGVVAIGLVTIRQWRRTRALVRAALPAPPEVQALVSELAGAAGLQAAPAARLSAEAATPFVTGLVRPVILLPAASVESCSPDDLRMAVSHEIAHLRRQDLRWGLVPVVAETLFFFHPLARYASREYALGREAACDRAAIVATGADPDDYARVLLGLGVARPGTRLAAAGASRSLDSFKRRLVMLQSTSSRSLTARLLSGALVGAAVVALVPVTLTARPAPAPEVVTVDQNPPPPPPPPAPPSVPEPPTARRRTPPTPPAPPPPPPPPPQVQRMRSDASQTDLSYVLFYDRESHMMDGSRVDLRRAEEFRNGTERLLWVRRNGREYITRDAAVLDALEAAWKPVGEIGERQGSIGGQMGALGAEQGEIGARQGALGTEQAELGVRQAQIGLEQAQLSLRQASVRSDADRRSLDAELRRLDDRMRELGRAMDALNARMQDVSKPMEDLGRRMEALGDKMEVLGREMERASENAQRETLRIIDAAIANGTLQPVR